MAKNNSFWQNNRKTNSFKLKVTLFTDVRKCKEKYLTLLKKFEGSVMVEVKSVEAFLRGDISMPQFDDYFANQAKDYQNKLTKPQGSLGRVEDFAIWMAGWQKKINPTMDNTHCLIYAGNHGVATQGVSAYPSDVTAQMVENFKRGGAAINQICKLANIQLSVIPIDLEYPTRDFSKEAAMGLEETIAAMQLGFDSVNQDCDLLLLGEMGISNTCLLYTSPSPRDRLLSRMPSSA